MSEQSPNNDCEQEMRPTVIFRKVANGFRSGWAGGYQSVTGTARRGGSTQFQAVSDLVRERLSPDQPREQLPDPITGRASPSPHGAVGGEILSSASSTA